jgi:hypothetical protein
LGSWPMGRRNFFIYFLRFSKINFTEQIYQIYKFTTVPHGGRIVNPVPYGWVPYGGRTRTVVLPVANANAVWYDVYNQTSSGTAAATFFKSSYKIKLE